MKTRTCSLLPVLLVLLAALQAASAQKNGIDIYSLTVDSKVSSRFAHTVITSRVVNKADTVQEATFQMELPKRAFITNFSMTIDGVTYPGNIKDKAAAQEQYSAAVSRGQSAGLVKSPGHEDPAAPALPQMDIHIFEPQGIRLLETESTFLTNELAEALTTTQSDTKAHILFKPTLAQQQKSPEQQETALDGSFIVHYDVNRTLSGGSIQVENGYFVHYFAPEGLTAMAKNVVFVIDKSGSMSGRKIQQTREALVKILDDLRPQDQFNLIVFSSEASPWRPLLVPASAENVDEAKRYAAGIQAHGGTNINGAMMMAVELLDSSNQKEQLPAGSVSLIILLTDGDPTVGETNPSKIQENVREAVGGQYSLFCLGFGFDVSYSFLEKLALDNGGLVRRIYQDSDSALQLQDFYQEVANPLLTSVAFEYPGSAVEMVTRENFRLFFKGSEMVVAGKLRGQGPAVLSAQVTGRVHKQNFTFQTESNVAQEEETFRGPKYIFHSFMERLWAYLTIQQLLEDLVSASDAERPALEQKALNLSLHYSFVTPLTSMVVTKPEGQEQSQVAEKPKEDEDNRHMHHFYSRLHLVPGSALGAGPGQAQRGGSRFRVKGSAGGHYPETLSAVRTRKKVGWRVFAGLPTMSGDPRLPGAAVVLAAEPPDMDTLRVPDYFGLSSLIKPSGLPRSVSVSASPGAEAPTPAPLQAPDAILPLPGQSVHPLCVDLKHAQGPVHLLSDPDQGLEVTGQFEKTHFSWIEVTFKNPKVCVHVSPEHVMVTRDQGSSAHQWKKTLFTTMPGLKMTMDRTGLLLLTSPNKVTLGLMSWEGPGAGLRLLLRDTDRFSSHVSGTLGQFYQNVLWKPEAAEDGKGTLTVQGTDHPATRELKLDYQQGPPGAEMSCWSVVL
ncbi:inter-alpha-trypsin inhibitor heavy chain H4 [Echinops telfairi]|uniref:Inter-alpha-trypsin inhibitor heavy chain H4 n=1 Tax=Echinops telfairi TaxID=9371 RepID=A0AC55DNN0_ECHTE|nr:inter-alpha-trypsin inhibitor heavy chain H4 [Echinops telfairi]